MQITLPNQWAPRAYQRPLWDALEQGAKRAIAVWHRRAGKDLTVLNYMACASQRRIGTYWHVAPTYKQGRKIVWEGITRDGVRFLDAFPGWRNPHRDNFVTRVRDDEMTLWLANGSTFQVIGAEDVDRLVGPNPIGIGLTEYSIQDPKFWEFMRPILLENDGFALFIFTPRGRNHGHKLWQMAQRNDRWFTQLLTVEDTERMSREAGEPIPVTAADIELEREDGMAEELIQQEFFCSFDAPLEGSYYGDLMTRIQGLDQIGKIPWDPGKEVITAWDIGVGDYNSIVFAQRVAKEVRIIDYLQDHSKGIDHYVKLLREKPYVYDEHLAPHDMKVREWGSGGRSRIEIAKDLGVNFRVVRKLGLDDGIQAVRQLIPQCWFNETTCDYLIQALKEYTKRKDQEGLFLDKPKHDWTSHPCDAFRTLAVGLRSERYARPPVLTPRLAIV